MIAVDYMCSRNAFTLFRAFANSFTFTPATRESCESLPFVLFCPR